MSGARELGEQIRRALGLLHQEGWVDAIHRAEPELLEKHGMSLSQLVERVATEPHLLREIAGLLTIGETHFFRHPSHFDHLVQHVSGQLSGADPFRRVVIWSAGCASGEEPYSLAMMIHATLGEDALRRVHIYATDVDPKSVAKAIRARYTEWSFRGTPEWAIRAYFQQANPRERQLVHAGIRAAVTFEEDALESRLQAMSPHSLDAIFFRNVAIYLEEDARERLHTGMHRALRADGILMQGPSDPIPLRRHFTPASQDPAICVYAPAYAAPSHPAPPSSAAPDPARSLRDETLRARRSGHPRPSSSTLPAATSSRALHSSVSRRLESSGRELGPRHRVGRAAPEPRPMARPAKLAMARTSPSVAAQCKADAEAALKHAERNEILLALELATTLVERDPACAQALLVRGQVFLAAMRLEEAREDLRQAVFLDPDAALTRYWYASTLHVSGMGRRAAKQLEELERQLGERPASALLEDEETTAGQLREAARLMAESYQ